jgi:hypothetical protein
VLRSIGDRIEGISVGIHAAAGRRVRSTSSLVSDNRVELVLENLTIRTASEDGADLELYATLAVPDPDVGQEYPVGDRNVLHVRIDGAAGSGERANAYIVDFGPTSPENRGGGNRIVFAGDRSTFSRRNRSFQPAPPPELFVGDH